MHNLEEAKLYYKTGESLDLNLTNKDNRDNRDNRDNKEKEKEKEYTMKHKFNGSDIEVIINVKRSILKENFSKSIDEFINHFKS